MGLTIAHIAEDRWPLIIPRAIMQGAKRLEGRGVSYLASPIRWALILALQRKRWKRSSIILGSHLPIRQREMRKVTLRNCYHIFRRIGTHAPAIFPYRGNCVSGNLPRMRNPPFVPIAYRPTEPWMAA